MASRNKILVLLPNRSTVLGSDVKIGFNVCDLAFMLDELGLRYFKSSSSAEFLGAVDFATLNGGGASVSPPSESSPYDQCIQKMLDDCRITFKLKTTLRLSSLEPNNYRAVLVPGGYGIWMEAEGNSEIARFLERCYFFSTLSSLKTSNSHCLICTVGLGAAVLINMENPHDKTPFVKGRAITCLSREEDEQNLNEISLEERMKKLGASISFMPPHQSNVQVDDLLVTGQNSQSSRGVIEKMMRVIESCNRPK